MSNSVRAGYMGLADLGGTKVRCTSFSVNPNQDVLFYNHVIGLKDTIPTDSKTKGETTDVQQGSTYANVQRKIWRPSPISIVGGVSFPVTETSIKNIFKLARYANYFDIDFTYFCKGSTGSNSRTFSDCRINGFDLSIMAGGEVVSVNMDVVAKNVVEKNMLVSYTTSEKFITWENAHVTITNAPFNINDMLVSGFNFKINNNIQTIYTTGTETATDESLLPYDLRVGMQEVTGTLTVYMDAGKELIPIDLAIPANILVDFPDLPLNITAVFKSNQIEGLVGPVVTQLPFVGVDYSFV